MKFIVTVTFCWLIFGVNLGAAAAPLVGSDHRLQFMQKIQGSWLRDCRKAAHKGKVFYEQTRLSVSYTHLNFKTGEYKDNNCVQLIREYKTRYLYTVGDLVEPTRRAKVYEMNIDLNAEEPGIIRMVADNIVQFDSGFLYFGERSLSTSFHAGAKRERLTSLDRQTPFYRP